MYTVSGCSDVTASVCLVSRALAIFPTEVGYLLRTMG